MSDLERRLIRLRLLLHSEAPSAMHPGARNPDASPVLRDHEGIPERDGDFSGVGPPFTAAFHRYLAGPDHWGLTRLGMLSIIEVSEACASKHPTHRRPMFTRTVCAELLFEAAYMGQNVIDLVWLHPEMTYPQIHGQLEWGLRHAEDWRATMFARWSKVPGDEEPMPERVRGVA